MKIVKEIIATVGTYTNKEGEEKKQYQKIGKMFKREDGTFTIKLDAIPVGNDFSGWCNLYDPKPYEPNTEQTKTEQKTEDDLPF